MKAYWQAVADIPKGETRTYRELAVLAGRPGGARVAGRAVAALANDSRLPWHRVVRSDGAPKPSERESLQWRRLRREGARPRARESVAAWAARVGATLVGNYPTREFVPRRDLAGLSWRPERVEPLRDEAAALARGFRLLGVASGGSESESESVPLPPKQPLDGEPEDARAPLRARLDELRHARQKILSRLEDDGAVRLRGFLSEAECRAILSASSDPSRYERSTEMAAKGYGVGAYHFYREPLPEPLPELRERLFALLRPPDYPEHLESFWDQCRARGQRRSSSILIGYPRGGVNHLHRDVYGPVAFPYQALVMLSKRGRDFDGGEFVLEYAYELEGESRQRQREFSVSQGDVLIFRTRPHRHGMRIVRRGTRYGVGVVFHLAE